MTCLLSAHNLSVSIKGTRIVRNVSLRIEEGEAISLIGPNGAGKTTLLKTLLGLHQEYDGEIDLLGKPLGAYSVRERARWMAYVPQMHDFSDFCTVEEFIEMGRYPYLALFRQPQAGDHQAVQMALRLTDTQHMAGRVLQTLSGGEQQKVMIAAALAQQPTLLLLDEPVTFLDPKNQVEIQKLLCKINRETGTTILSVTHDINSALQTSSRIIGLRAGEIVFNDTPTVLANEQSLETIYDAKFRLLIDPQTNQSVVIPAMGQDDKESGE
jgi:ABC-type cobalamin/Fe3+-siderophores transport system ATPase subunit